LYIYCLCHGLQYLLKLIFTSISVDCSLDYPLKRCPVANTPPIYDSGLVNDRSTSCSGSLRESSMSHPELFWEKVKPQEWSNAGKVEG
jgi:hypothetical protein